MIDWQTMTLGQRYEVLRAHCYWLSVWASARRWVKAHPPRRKLNRDRADRRLVFGSLDDLPEPLDPLSDT